MSEAKTRVYVVDIEGQRSRLVRASHPISAVRHVTNRMLAVHFPTQDELIELLANGVRVEEAGQDENENAATLAGNGDARQLELG